MNLYSPCRLTIHIGYRGYRYVYIQYTEKKKINAEVQQNSQ